MKVRPVNLDEDYDTLALWWESHGWQAVPRKFLPALGVMVESDAGDKLAAGFVHMCNSSPVCWLEWVVANPRNRPTVSLLALKAVVGAAKDAVASLNDGVHGYGPMLTTCRQPALARFYESMGFKRTDENVMHLVCMVPQLEEVKA
jgi:hypothetical protein